ncbi:MAG: hypothetical protein R3292_07920 [Alcanivorax sp.]|nr:hypothetical protein [Alcanivorax sp.]
MVDAWRAAVLAAALALPEMGSLRFSADADLETAGLAAARLLVWGLAVAFFGAAFFGAGLLAATFLGAGLAAAFLAAGFLTTAFLAGAFFTAVFLAAGLAAVFFAAGFLAVAFLAGAFFAAAFLAAGLVAVFLAAGFLAAAFLAGAFLAAALVEAEVLPVPEDADVVFLLLEAVPVACFLAAFLGAFFLPEAILINSLSIFSTLYRFTRYPWAPAQVKVVGECLVGLRVRHGAHRFQRHQTFFQRFPDIGIM